MSESAKSTWDANWPANIRKRVRELGFDDVSSFLAARQAIPMYLVARELGVEVAAVQLIQLRFGEVMNKEDFSNASKDLLCRVLRSHLRKGWKSGVHSERMMAGARSEWLAAMEVRTGLQNFREPALAIWNELENASPTVGWLPSSSSDDIIARAVANGLANVQLEEATRIG